MTEKGVDVAGDDSVNHDLVLHDNDNGVEPFAFEESLFFGDDEREGRAAVSRREG